MSELLLDGTLGVLLLGLAAGALHARQLYAAVLLFIAFGLILALVWARLGVADLALAEAAIGAGLTGVLLFAALARQPLEGSEPRLPAPRRLAVLAVLLLGFTSMPEEPGWRQSSVVPWLQPTADWLREKLPHPPESPAMALMDLGKSVLAGDNGGPNEADAGSGLLPASLEGTRFDPRQRSAEESRADPAGALPSNIDPAQVRPGQLKPIRVEPQGQARPPSR